jgi:prepilin-type N-terminal cleavage/methylation domain-containing protein
MKTRASGFTLIEMAVAVALMSLVGLAMFASLRFAQRTYAKVIATETALDELATSQRVLRGLIESAYPFANDGGLTGAPRNLVGGKNEIAFSAPAALGSGGAGFDRYAILLRRNPVSFTYDVVVRRWVDRNGQSTLTEADVVEEPLVSNVASLEWGYLAPPSPQGFGGLGADRSQSWLDGWREHDRLPQAVRVRIKYASKDSRNLSEVGPDAWPELIVAPKITDDANCEFDVVAQACRSGS